MTADTPRAPRRCRTFARWLVVVVALVPFLAAPAAQAVPVLLDFEDLSVFALTGNPVPGDWYKNVSGNAGIEFGPANALGLPATLTGMNQWGCLSSSDTAPHAQTSSPIARSGQLSLRFNGCTGGEFPLTGALVRCDVDCASVELFAGRASASGNVLRANAYDAAGTLLATDVTTLATGGARNRLFVSDMAEHISFVTLYGEPGFAGDLFVDDLTFTPAAAAAAGFSLGFVGGVRASVTQGQMSDWTITLFRRNGSTGQIDLAAQNLPAGVTASFNPPSLTGTATQSTMTLTATTNAAVGDVAASVVGTPLNAVQSGPAATLPVTVRVAAPFAIRPQPTTVRSPRCTPTDLLIGIDIAPGFAQPIALTAAPVGQHPEDRVDLEKSSLSPADGATQFVHVTSTTGGNSFGDQLIRITATSGPFTVIQDLPIRNVFPPAIARVSPVQVRPPTGSVFGDHTVTITGAGFCGGEKVRLGNALAVVDPVSLARSSTALIDPLTNQPVADVPRAQLLTVTVPRYATPGTVTVTSPNDYWALRNLSSTSTLDAGRLEVTDFRSQNGFAFPNFKLKSATFGDFTRAFGRDQTHIRVDLCFPLGCDIWVPDPVVLLGSVGVSIAMTLNSGSAVCFGVSSTSLRLRSGSLKYADFPPGDAKSVFGLTSVATSIPLREEIIAAQVRQLGLEYIATYAALFLSGNGLDAAGVANAIRTKLQQVPGGVMVAMPQDLVDGHVVVAYDVADLGGGQYAIQVYDPNRPWDDGEVSDTTGAKHQKDLDESRILLSGTTYTFKIGATTTYNGDVSHLMIVDANHVRTKPTIPFGIAGGVNRLLSWQPGDPPPLPTIARAGGRPHQRPRIAVAGSANLVPIPVTPEGGEGGLYLVHGDGPATLAASASGRRLVGFAQDRSGAARVEIGPGGAIAPSLGLAPDGAFKLDLGAARRPVSVKLSTKAPRGVTTSVDLRTTATGASTFDVTRSGAVSWSSPGGGPLRIALQKIDPKAGLTTRSATVAVPAGGRVAITADGRSVRIRDRSGAIRTSALREVKRASLRLAKVKASFRKGVLRVTGTVRIPAALRGRDATLSLTITRGRKVVATATASVDRLKSTAPLKFAVAVRKRPGLRFTVGVAALDASGLVSVARTQRRVPGT